MKRKSIQFYCITNLIQLHMSYSSHISTKDTNFLNILYYVLKLCNFIVFFLIADIFCKLLRGVGRFKDQSLAWARFCWSLSSCRAMEDK